MTDTYVSSESALVLKSLLYKENKTAQDDSVEGQDVKEVPAEAFPNGQLVEGVYNLHCLKYEEFKIDRDNAAFTETLNKGLAFVFYNVITHVGAFSLLGSSLSLLPALNDSKDLSQGIFMSSILFLGGAGAIYGADCLRTLDINLKLMKLRSDVNELIKLKLAKHITSLDVSLSFNKTYYFSKWGDLVDISDEKNKEEIRKRYPDKMYLLNDTVHNYMYINEKGGVPTASIKRELYINHLSNYVETLNNYIKAHELGDKSKDGYITFTPFYFDETVNKIVNISSLFLVKGWNENLSGYKKLGSLCFIKSACLSMEGLVFNVINTGFSIAVGPYIVWERSEESIERCFYLPYEQICKGGDYCSPQGLKDLNVEYKDKIVSYDAIYDYLEKESKSNEDRKKCKGNFKISCINSSKRTGIGEDSLEDLAIGFDDWHWNISGNEYLFYPAFLVDYEVIDKIGHERQGSVIKVSESLTKMETEHVLAFNNNPVCTLIESDKSFEKAVEEHTSLCQDESCMKQ